MRLTPGYLTALVVLWVVIQLHATYFAKIKAADYWDFANLMKWYIQTRKVSLLPARRYTQINWQTSDDDYTACMDYMDLDVWC